MIRKSIEKPKQKRPAGVGGGRTQHFSAWETKPQINSRAKLSCCACSLQPDKPPGTVLNVHWAGTWLKTEGKGQREYYAAGKNAFEALSFLMWMCRLSVKQKHSRTGVF